MSVTEKKALWNDRVGKLVVATNYRGITATGTLLAVGDGVWGYGGDAVALKLDVQDDWGSEHWPADRCRLALHTGPIDALDPEQSTSPSAPAEDPDAAMRSAFESKYQRDWNDPAGDEMKLIWADAWGAAMATVSPIGAQADLSVARTVPE